MKEVVNRQNINKVTEDLINSVYITDIHTHLFSQCFESMFLYGIEELLTYHYLVAEAMRYTDMDYKNFYDMDKDKQAEFVWNILFVKNTPLSEPAKSIITIFNSLGLDVNVKDINYFRKFFESKKLSDYIDQVFEISKLKCVVMTNDPLDDDERKVWDNSYVKDERFKAALRLDRVLNSWEESFTHIKKLGYNVEKDLLEPTIEEIKKFLIDYIDRMEALYCAVSLPPDFSMNDGSVRAKIIENCVLPVCREKNIPFALMIGVKRGVNPALKLAGDSVKRADIEPLEYLCSEYPYNKFLVTMLSLENQQELTVTARKFKNLMVFGCWWFLNSPSLIEFVTNMRIEWLGTSFIPQHSDCRVFEQLISKWKHSKKVIANVLATKYSDLMSEGYEISNDRIERDINNLFGENFWKFIEP
ncbi:glucuronate isomerase [Herbivorax sp. ANBcel31]|uniref:glucuronate isomerase n=1 Tax=Herbivorax sp. ANBcel31 TaxID=3069754 RepID=UPI0027B5A056|nr:glucuronate isomerase [Herbivorax sp. ANBcel31]MDQ2084873.1 glucuronate isomerase [Herbivorax sp. ANBcel31]